MPWRLVLFLVVLALVVAFAGFNLQNVASVSFGFYTLQEVPVFLSLFSAFFLGVIVMLPFTFGRRSRSARKKGGRDKSGAKDSKTAAITPKTSKESHGTESQSGPSSGLQARSSNRGEPERKNAAKPRKRRNRKKKGATSNGNAQAPPPRDASAPGDSS